MSTNRRRVWRKAATVLILLALVACAQRPGAHGLARLEQGIAAAWARHVAAAYGR